jgi:hypothetical protein
MRLRRLLRVFIEDGDDFPSFLSFFFSHSG